MEKIQSRKNSVFGNFLGIVGFRLPWYTLIFFTHYIKKISYKTYSTLLEVFVKSIMIFILSGIPLHGINMRIYYRYKSERMQCGQRLDQVEYRLEVSSVTFDFTFTTQRLLPILYETI